MKKFPENLVLLSGNEALAQGAYEAGLLFAASYPGTPAVEILEYLARRKEVDCQWSVNEKVAFEVAFSSAIAGRRSLYASKHVGLNVAMDSLMTSAYMGVNAGFIVVSCDDPGLFSSQNEQDNRLFAKVAKIPLLEPSSPAEAREFAKAAFSVSERFDTPVLLRLTIRIAHCKESMLIGKRKEAPAKEFKADALKYVMLPRHAYKRHIEVEKRLIRLKACAQNSPLNKIELKQRKIGFITSGVSYFYCKEIYPDASFLKLGMPYPFPTSLAQKFSALVKEIYVVEELEPFLEEELKISGIRCKVKHPSFRVGELRPEYIPLIVRGRPKPREERGLRKLGFCPGCGYAQVFSVLKKLKLLVTGDIGCYTLGAIPPLSCMHTCLCMGSSITFLEGFRRSLKEKSVAVIGDSTFIHAGIPALINLSYNQTKGVVIILDNGTTAMTGFQPHPGTGLTIRGEPTKKLSLEEICTACGAENVDAIDPHNIKDLETLIRRRVSQNCLSVVIARRPCMTLEKKRIGSGKGL